MNKAKKRVMPLNCPSKGRDLMKSFQPGAYTFKAKHRRRAMVSKPRLNGCCRQGVVNLLSRLCFCPRFLSPFAPPPNMPMMPSSSAISITGVKP